jgi:hypothetical protein
VLITVAFIVLVAWASTVLVAAGYHGRLLGRAHHIAIAFCALGVLLVLPVLIIGTYGLPTSSSFRWLGVVGRVGYAGLTLVALGAAGWLLLDTAFVWRERRRVFPFAYRGRHDSEA